MYLRQLLHLFSPWLQSKLCLGLLDSVTRCRSQIKSKNCPKNNHSRFYLKSVIFQNSPQSGSFGLHKREKLSPRSFKSSPIWSHCSWRSIRSSQMTLVGQERGSWWSDLTQRFDSIWHRRCCCCWWHFNIKGRLTIFTFQRFFRAKKKTTTYLRISFVRSFVADWVNICGRRKKKRKKK